EAVGCSSAYGVMTEPWLSEANALASRAKRAFNSMSTDGRTLIATSRPRRGWRARYTSPMLPAPIAETTSYEPIRVPGARLIVSGGAAIIRQHQRDCWGSHGRCW